MRITIILLSFILSFNALAGNKKKEKALRSNIITTSKKYVGVKYKMGGTTPKGFDCSGFTGFVFKNNGIALPRTSINQSKEGKKVSLKKAKPGDLIFFTGYKKKPKKVGHVGIVVKSEKGVVTFIHASSSKGIRIDNTQNLYYKPRFLKVTNPI